MGCTEQPEVAPDLSFSEVVIPDNYKSAISNGIGAPTEFEVEEIDVKVITNEGKEIIGKLRFTMPVGDEETLIKFEMTNNIFGETPLTPNFWIINDLETNTSEARISGSSCIAGCQTAFTIDGEKQKGRGACKALCWLEVVIAVAAVVVAAIAIR